MSPSRSGWRPHHDDVGLPQDRPRYELDHLYCIAGASTPENADLVVLAVDTKHAVLMGLDTQSVVIKPVEDGDDRLSYIALYDTCYTIADLARMKRAGVFTPEDAPLDTFQLDLDFVIEGTFGVSVKLRALHHGDARVRLRSLLEHDVMFREAVIEEVLRGARRDGETPYRVRESESGDVEQLPADRDYEVLSRDT